MNLPTALVRPALIAFISSLVPLASARPQTKPTSVSADQVANRVSAAAILAHLTFLADDALEGRGTGTRGGLIAAKYVAAQFRRLGLEPAGDSGTYFQAVPLLGRTPTPSLRALVGDSTVTFRPREDYVLVPVTNDTVTELTADVVFAGYGIEAANRRWDDYKDADVRGKIVLLLANDPDSTVFDRASGRPWTAVREKMDEAARRGAAGVLVIHTPSVGAWKSVAAALSSERIALRARPGPVRFWGWITAGAANDLLGRAGQSLEQLIAAAQTRDFRAVPLPLRLDATILTALRPVNTMNVVARLPGRGAHAGESVLLGAHYDHLGIGRPEHGDSIYNGAEDNASGVAAMLAAAQAFAKSGVRTARSLVFVAFGAEELGLMGSDELAVNPPPALGRVVGAIALDVQNLYGRTRDIGSLGLSQSSLGRAFRAAAKAEKLAVIEDPDDLRRGRFYRSDQYSFVRAGVPAIRVLNGLDYVGRPSTWGAEQRERYWNERYHRPSDAVAEWMSMDGIAQQVRVTVRFLEAVANAARSPEWAVDSDFRPASPAK